MASQERRTAMSAAYGVVAVVLYTCACTLGAVVVAQKPASTFLIVLCCLLAFIGSLTLYMTFAAIRGWWPTGNPHEVPSDPVANINTFHGQLDAMAKILATENAVQKRILARNELPVPWKTSAGIRGENASDLCLSFALMNVPQMIILGKPGAGKTTMATLLAIGLFQLHDSADSNLKRFPVRLSVASWTSMGGTLREWTFTRLGAEYPRLLACLDAISRLGYADALVDEWLIPIYDGFDEIKESERPEFLRMLARDFAGSPLVLTSRVAQYEEAKLIAAPPSCAVEVFMKRVKEGDAWAYLTHVTESPVESWNAVFASPSWN
jgi:hypothetical protein